MLKNLKRASAIMLSLAMAVQFGMADTYFANTLSEEPIIEETQEQEPVTVEEGSQQVAVEQTEAPAIDAKEEFVQVPETKSVTLSYVAEDGTILQDATTHEYEMGYSLNSDASVMLNFDGYTLKDVVMNDSQIVAAAQANLNEYIKLDRDKSTFKSHRDFCSEKEITFKHLQGELFLSFCYSIFRRDWT